jgi:hypothetical protein
MVNISNVFFCFLSIFIGKHSNQVMRAMDTGSGTVTGSLDWFESLTGKSRNIDEIQAKIVALQEELEKAQVEIMSPEEKEKFMENKAKARVSAEMREVQ